MIDETRGERIHRLRRRLRMSEADLGELCEVGREAVYLWEQDVCAPPKVLAEVLGVSEDYIEHGDQSAYRRVFAVMAEAIDMSQVDLRQVS